MAENKIPSNDYQRIDPDDFENYEEQFVDKGGGGGKSSGHKGKKTIHALKNIVDNLDIHEKNVIRYCAWIEDNISELAALNPSDCVITFTKSGGPGGQNVNKRETKVMIVHKPTNIRVESDQTRSQMQNKNLALENLRERLQYHLAIWKEYLKPDQSVDAEQVQVLLD